MARISASNSPIAFYEFFYADMSLSSLVYGAGQRFSSVSFDLSYSFPQFTVEGLMEGDFSRRGDSFRGEIEALSLVVTPGPLNTDGSSQTILVTELRGTGLQDLQEFTYLDGFTAQLLGGRDRMNGTRHDDSFSGHDGRDVLLGRRGDDSLNGGGGNDRVVGHGGDDYLNGDDGRDLLVGGTGNDNLRGGNGQDDLRGGRGADMFVFDPGASRAGDGRRDVILDFDQTQDQIDVAHFLFGEDAPDGFSFRGTRGFTGEGAELRFQNGILQMDFDGDRQAEFEVELIGVTQLTGTDWLFETYG